MSIESALERRERFANRYDYDFGQERIFPGLTEALLEEVPEGTRVLEVGAATGLLTGPLLARAGRLTAIEPSEGMLRRLLAKDVADSPNLRVLRGMAEDLSRTELYDVAVVTFTPRRGIGLLRLLQELAVRVTDRVVMLLDDDRLDGLGVSRARSSDARIRRASAVRLGACEPTPRREASGRARRGGSASGAVTSG